MAYWRDTPSHGWLICNRDELERMPEIARRASYEEDVEWTIAVLALPELADWMSMNTNKPTEYYTKLAHDTCRDYYPDIFEALTGETATHENSLMRAQDKFNADHANDYVVICASGDWKEGVPKGKVECIATKGGLRNSGVEERVFYVDKQDYEIGQFGYVIPDSLL